MRQKLTKRLCESVPVPAEGTTTIGDSEVRGFELRVSAVGNRSFFLRYRTMAGDQRHPKIGTFPEMGVDAARKQARLWLGERDRGGDPSYAKRAARKDARLADFVDDFLAFLEGKRKPATILTYRLSLKTHVVPALGTRRIATITRAHIAQLHSAISKTGRRGAANMMVAVMSALFSYAEQVGARPEGTNPARRITRNRETPKERFLDGEEFARLAKALDEAEGTSPWAVAAIRLLLLTGMRKNEVLGLQWSFIDAESRRVFLPDSKTGAKTVHVPPEAITILEGLEKMREPGPYVFPGPGKSHHAEGLQEPWKAIRTAAQLPGLRIHDLRHSFASIGAGLGMSLAILGRALGHHNQATTQRYAHFLPDVVSVAVDTIGAAVAKAMAGGAKIIPTDGAAAQAEEVQEGAGA